MTLSPARVLSLVLVAAAYALAWWTAPAIAAMGWVFLLLFTVALFFVRHTRK
jgi:hypothetical protein